MNDLKTTVSAVIGTVAWVVAKFGLDVPIEVTQGIEVITILAIGIFARDTYERPRIDVNPSILNERNRSNEIRQRVSDKTKLKKV